MLKLRKFLEKINGHGLQITNWEEVDLHLQKELSAFLDHTLVVNSGEAAQQSVQRTADNAAEEARSRAIAYAETRRR